MRHIWLILVTFFLAAPLAQGQTLQEKILLESPRLSYNVSASYFTNLQEANTYQNTQSSVFRFSPRYRLNDTYTVIGGLGFSQVLTQEERTDFLNSRIGITRKPFKIGQRANLRPTLNLILPTNEQQRKQDSLRSGFQLTLNTFINTNTSYIMAIGAQLQKNIHQFNISARRGANIEWLITPYATLGKAFGRKFQFITSTAYTRAWTYRGTQRGLFSLDQSLTYIPTRRASISIGHNNRGTVLARDGSTSNVNLFNSRTSVFYLSGLYNF